MNAALGSTPLSSPLESPDVIHTFIPFSDIGAATTSMASIKLSSIDLPIKNHQVRSSSQLHHHNHHNHHQQLSSNTTRTMSSSVCSILNNNSSFGGSGITTTTMGSCSIISSSSNNNNNNNNSKSLTAIPETISELPELIRTNLCLMSNDDDYLSSSGESLTVATTNRQNFNLNPTNVDDDDDGKVDFSLSSVGRSFFDQTTANPDDTNSTIVLNTPDTPPPNISPSSSNRFSETFSTDFNKQSSTPSIIVSPIIDELTIENYLQDNFDGSWDLLELDLDLHEVNHDPSFIGDVQECMFFGDDPFGILPVRPTPPDSLDL